MLMNLNTFAQYDKIGQDFKEIEDYYHKMPN
jgi:hypothetical protein